MRKIPELGFFWKKLPEYRVQKSLQHCFIKTKQRVKIKKIRKIKKFEIISKIKVFCRLQSFKMGKEDHFMAQMARLDGPAKFLHKSFTVQTDSISNVIGKKLSVESLMSSSTDKNKKDIKKSYAKTIEKKKKDNRQIFVPSIGNICMRFQLSGQTKPFWKFLQFC